MCGRFLNALPAAEIARIFSVRSPYLDFRPTYNVAPTQSLPVVRFNVEKRERQIDLLRCCLMPLWAKDLSGGAKCINTRAETVATKPTLRDAFAKRRCIVPAGGFYEWKKLAEGKQPYAIVPKDGTIFALAGLWERWKTPENGEWIRTLRSSPVSRTQSLPKFRTACPSFSTVRIGAVARRERDERCRIAAHPRRTPPSQLMQLVPGEPAPQQRAE